jgi:hypothetical protein
MLSQLHIPSNFKFKYSFGGQVPSKPLHLMNFFSFGAFASIHMGELENQL